MDLRGLERFSLIDYPGHISCIVFTGGCDFRCPFCHNPCLVFDPTSQPRVTEQEFFNFLKSRLNRLEGVVISGGEPMLQPDLPDFIRRIKEMGFLVKLDTNGSFPEKLKTLCDDAATRPDLLAIDYKAPKANYASMTCAADPAVGETVCESLRFAVSSGIKLDIRTTVHRTLLSEEDLARMRRELDDLGITTWMLQQFNPVEVIDDELSKIATYTDNELVAIARKLAPHTRVRGLNGRTML